MIFKKEGRKTLGRWSMIKEGKRKEVFIYETIYS